MNHDDRQLLEPTLLPRRRIGMVAPLLVTSEISYQFYRMQAEMSEDWPAVLAESSIDLRDFSPSALQDAESHRLERAVEGLVHKGAELVVLSGVPIVVLATWKHWERRLQSLGQQNGVPFVSDFECSIQALTALGARSIAIANKWDDDMNRQLVSDIEDYSDLKVVGIGTDRRTAGQISGMRAEDGIESCRAACRHALDGSHGTPDAIFLAGGSWFSTLATASLEEEFGVPIVTNPGASMWYALSKVDCFRPIRSFGQLYTRKLQE